jgi:hypothetical protein
MCGDLSNGRKGLTCTWGWHHQHAIKVKVIGSAAADQGFGGPGARSFSADYVTIVPQGWWWA